MSQLYEDLLEGYIEIGEIEGDQKLVRLASEYLDQAKQEKSKHSKKYTVQANHDKLDKSCLNS